MFVALALFPSPSELDRILSNPKFDGAVISATVLDADGKTLYDHNGSIHVVPASNQKLLSNAFALWSLGPDYRPKTNFWKLPNRIVIDSPGDPLMTYNRLIQARDALKLDRRLPVFVHQSYAPEIPDSWEIDDLPNRYSAAVTSLTFDQGAFTASIRQGRVCLLPEAFGVKIDRIASKGKVDLRYDLFARRITVSGELPAKDQMLDTLALPRPDEAAASLFGSSFHSISEVPNQAPDYVIEGGSTIEMVGRCLPPSDNNIAENLLLMGAQVQGPLGPRPYELARTRLESFLTRVVGIQPSDVHAYDGSGLSRHNYVTTRAIGKLLAWESSQPTGVAWRNAMAHPGIGTLSNRLKGLTFQAKTGSLDMVASISGYLTTKLGKNVIVSLIFNQFGCTASEARGIADQFITTLAND